MAYVYDQGSLDSGVYKHHTGSSVSSPKGSRSWIEALRKAFDQHKFPCCAVNCDSTGTLGAHLRVSRLHEIGGKIGIGGTAVVPMCDHHHGTGAVEIVTTACIWDKSAPVDLRKSTSIQLTTSGRCSVCELELTLDPEDGAWCSDCGHFTDLNGHCDTDSCTSCAEDYDDDDNDNDYAEVRTSSEQRYRKMQEFGRDIARRYRNG